MEEKMDKKVLLISMAYDKYENQAFNEESRIPLGILLLQDVFRSNNVVCDVFDLNRSKNSVNTAGSYEKLLNSIEVVTDYDYIGISSISNNFINAVLLAEQIKKMYADKIVYLGGPHASIIYKEALETYSFIDFIAVGEGENFAKEFSEYVHGNRLLKNVTNVACQIKGTEKNYTLKESKLLDAENIPLLNPYFDIKNHNTKKARSVSIEGGRGCPYNCTFCSTSHFWKRKARMKPVERILHEMKELNRVKGVTSFKIIHDLFTTNKEFVKEFISEIKEYNFKWNCSARVDTIELDLLEEMYASGCQNMFFGVETFNQEFQSYIKKNLDLSKIESLVRFCVEKKFEITLGFILGLPFDNEKSISENLHAVFKYNIFSNVHISDGILTPEPGTEIYDENRENLVFDEDYLSINYDYVPIDRKLESEHIRKYPSLYSHFYYVPIDKFTIFAL